MSGFRIIPTIPSNNKAKDMKATWNGKIIAESDDIINIEGNSYFPMESINKELLSESPTSTVCHWKGTASYFNVEIDGKLNNDAAWYYSDPSGLAQNIKGRVAFWRGVKIEK